LSDLKNSVFFKDVMETFFSRIGGVIVAFIASIAVSKYSGSVMGLLISGAITLAVYSLPVYGTMWKIGNRDLNQATFGHIEKDVFRGFKVCLMTSIPWLLLGFILVLTRFGVFKYSINIIFKIVNPEIVPFINLIKNTQFVLEYSIIQVLGIALLTLIPPILGGIYYILGLNDFSPVQKIVYKKQEPKAK